jgi:hypothetical protein
MNACVKAHVYAFALMSTHTAVHQKTASPKCVDTKSHVLTMCSFGAAHTIQEGDWTHMLLTSLSNVAHPHQQAHSIFPNCSGR